MAKAKRKPEKKPRIWITLCNLEKRMHMDHLRICWQRMGVWEAAKAVRENWKAEGHAVEEAWARAERAYPVTEEIRKGVMDDMREKYFTISGRKRHFRSDKPMDETGVRLLDLVKSQLDKARTEDYAAVAAGDVAAITYFRNHQDEFWKLYMAAMTRRQIQLEEQKAENRKRIIAAAAKNPPEVKAVVPLPDQVDLATERLLESLEAQAKAAEVSNEVNEDSQGEAGEPPVPSQEEETGGSGPDPAEGGTGPVP